MHESPTPRAFAATLAADHLCRRTRAIQVPKLYHVYTKGPDAHVGKPVAITKIRRAPVVHRRRNVRAQFR